MNTPIVLTDAEAERFWSKPIRSSFCWDWPGSGRGKFYWKGRQAWAYRVAWTLTNGPIPEGLTIDHRCLNPRCVNPQHLQAISAGQNTRFAHRKPTCKRGHLYEPDNIYMNPRGQRYCQECMRHHRQKQTRGLGPKASWTHCIRGHEYTPENTYRRPDTGSRMCRTCIAVRKGAQPEESHAGRNGRRLAKVYGVTW